MKKAFGLLVLALALATPAAAQQFATIVGEVIDDTGQPMPGVNVTLSGASLQGSRMVQTDIGGHFRFHPIPPGKDYKVVCELEGFQTATKSGLTAQLNAESSTGKIQMKFGSVSEQVVVEAKQIVVDTTKSTVDSNVDWGLIDTLATNRSFQGVMSMAPGTQVSANPYSPVNNPSVHGAQDDDNLYLINGFNQTDPRTLTWGNQINYDTIAEVQLQTAGFEAEFGRTNGGIINLVTKSGGNEVHGTLRVVYADRELQDDPKTYSYTNPSLDDTDPDKVAVENTKRPDVTTSELRPEATLGGFILKDTLWYYLSYERRNREQDFTRPQPAPCAGEPDPAKVECIDYSNPPSDTSSYEGYFLSGKLSWQLGSSNSLVGFYNTDPISISDTWQRYSSDSWDNAKSAENIQDQGGYLVGLNYTGILGSSTFVDVKASWYDAPLDVLPQYPMDGRNYYDINDSYNFGDSFYVYESQRQNSNVQLSVSHFVDQLAGSHTFKAGVEYLDAKTTETTLYNPYGQYYSYEFNYANPDDPERLAFWILVTDLIDVEHAQDYWGFYVQDKWQAGDFTFNLGVRAETQRVRNNEDDVVAEFKIDDRIMPRLGVAWDLSGLGVDWLNGSVARASWSRFRTFVSSAFGDTFDVFPNGYDIIYYDPVTNVETSRYSLVGTADLDPDLTVPYVDEWTVGYEQRIGRFWSVGLNYIDRTFENSIYFKYEDTRENLFATNLEIPQTEYQAFELSAKKSMAEDRIQLMASWTHEIKNEGVWALSGKGAGGPTVGTYGSCPEDYCTEGRIGRLDSENLVKVNGSYSHPWGKVGTTTVGISDYYYSGAVYGSYITRTNNFVTEADTELGDLNVGSWNRLDLHIEHEVPFDVLGGLSVSVYADVFNVLNRQSALNRSGYRGHEIDQPELVNNPRYGYPSAWQNPRVLQFGAKLEF